MLWDWPSSQRNKGHKPYKTYKPYNPHKPFKPHKPSPIRPITPHKTYKAHKPHKPHNPKKGLPHVIVRQAFFIIYYYLFFSEQHFIYALATAVASSVSLMRRPITRKAMGEATKIDDNVPITTPRLIAKAKLRMLSPPRKRMQSNTINVESDVLMVRAKVWLIESLKSDCSSALGCKPRFSRIRSNTTTLSLIE